MCGAHAAVRVDLVPVARRDVGAAHEAQAQHAAPRAVRDLEDLERGGMRGEQLRVALEGLRVDGADGHERDGDRAAGLERRGKVEGSHLG